LKHFEQSFYHLLETEDRHEGIAAINDLPGKPRGSSFRRKP